MIDLLGVPLYIDDRQGHNSIYLMRVPTGEFDTRLAIVGSTQAFGAWMAHHLAQAYDPRRP